MTQLVATSASRSLNASSRRPVACVGGSVRPESRIVTPAATESSFLNQFVTALLRSLSVMAA